MSIVRASDLVKTNFPGFLIPGFEKLIGRAQNNSSIFIWGIKYSGKSTISIMLAKGLSEVRGTVLYCSSEEGAGATMKDKIERMKAGVPDLLVGDFHGLDQLMHDVKSHKAKVLVLDSAHMAHLREKEQISLYEFCKHSDIIFVVVNHATKDGKYKGSTMLSHMVDVELRVADGVVYSEKNRLPHEVDEMVINFDQREPKTRLRKKFKKAAERPNPVPVPFKIPLSDIAKRHKIRGIKRLNDMVDFEHSCTIDRNPVSFRYKRQNKQSYLEMLQNGKVAHSHCANDFVGAWRKMSQEAGSIVIEIADQAHAKKVLGAQEYRRQEKQYASKGDKTAPKPKTATASTPATKTKPVAHSKPAVKVDSVGYIGSSKTAKGIPMVLVKTRSGGYEIKIGTDSYKESVFFHADYDKVKAKYEAYKNNADTKKDFYLLYTKYPGDKSFHNEKSPFHEDQLDKEIAIAESTLRELAKSAHGKQPHYIQIRDYSKGTIVWERSINTKGKPAVIVEDARKPTTKDGTVLRSSKTKSGTEIELLYIGGNYQIREDGKPIYEEAMGYKADKYFDMLKNAPAKKTAKPRKLQPKAKPKDTFDSRLDRLENLLSQAIA